MSNLLIEIGNTALKAAWSEGTTLGKTFRYQGEKYMEFILSLMSRQKPEILTVSCVRKLSEIEIDSLRSECGELIITGNSESYSLPEHLSPDRIASVIAVRHLFKGKACTLFDFGTTLTIDFIDKEGNYMGGRISPGCLTRFKALNRYSRSLPLLDFPQENEEESLSIESSIHAGVISGIMFEIEGYQSLFPDNILIFTGGDAIYFAKKMKNSIFAICNLVLMGLAIITDEYVKKKNS